MSVRAARLSLLGANQRLPYQLADGIAHLVIADLHGQDAFRAESLLDFLVGHERGGAAKIATLPDALGVEDGNGLATLAFDGGFGRLPAALRIGNAAQGRDEIVLDDDFVAGGGEFGLGGRDRAAERADQRLFGGIPLRLAAAGGAGEFFLGGGFTWEGIGVRGIGLSDGMKASRILLD